MLKNPADSGVLGTEQAVRVDVAACFRLLHQYGLSDFTDGFVSARIPDSPQDFVIGGYGLFPELARASQLHRRCLDSEPEEEKSKGVDLDAFWFTRTAMTAHNNIHACIHAHPKSTIALSAVDIDLLPLSQWGIMYGGRVAHMDFTTTEVTAPTECAKMGKLLSGGVQAIILRNHGVLAIGKTMAQAFFTLHRIELACELQLRAMSTGAKLRMPGPTLTTELMHSYWNMTRVDNDGSREWTGLLEKLDRTDLDFRN